ncbi:MAG: SPOR domain-containing protein, partial [Bacteroidales bacterium]|nr:SPOR domain-containing protein [Bacteroidales bacterium]
MKQLIIHTECLLSIHGYAIIPGFGGFISNLSPAYFEEKTAMWYPPKRQFAFNSSLFHNDGLLVDAYAETYGKNYAEAFVILENDVRELKKEIRVANGIQFGRIGQLNYDSNGQLLFHPVEDIHPYFASDMYGFFSLQISRLPMAEKVSFQEKSAEEETESNIYEVFASKDEEKTLEKWLLKLLSENKTSEKEPAAQETTPASTNQNKLQEAENTAQEADESLIVEITASYLQQGEKKREEKIPDKTGNDQLLAEKDRTKRQPLQKNTSWYSETNARDNKTALTILSDYLAEHKYEIGRLAVAAAVILMLLFQPVAIQVDNSHPTNYAKILTPVINSENADFVMDTSNFMDSELHPEQETPLPKIGELHVGTTVESDVTQQTEITPNNQKDEVLEEKTTEQKTTEQKTTEQKTTEQKTTEQKTTEQKVKKEDDTSVREPAMPMPNNDSFFVIAGSFRTSAEAQRLLNLVRNNGYANAGIIVRDGRHRVFVDSFNDRYYAYQFLQIFKDDNYPY